MAERSRELMTMIGNMQAGERLYMGRYLAITFNPIANFQNSKTHGYGTHN